MDYNAWEIEKWKNMCFSSMERVNQCEDRERALQKQIQQLQQRIQELEYAEPQYTITSLQYTLRQAREHIKDLEMLNRQGAEHLRAALDAAEFSKLT